MISRILFCVAASLVLPSSLTEYGLMPGKYSDFALDQQGNIIAADAEGNILKKDAQGRTLAMQAYSNHGGNPQIDASNGLQVLVYFPSSRHLLMLDNQLNQRRMVDFNALDNYQVSGLGLAADGNFWLLDGRNGFLQKLNYEGRVLAETMLAGAWLPAGKTRIYDDGKNVYLATEKDPLVRVLSATLNRYLLIPKPASNWDVRDGNLFYAIDSLQLVRETVGMAARRDTIQVSGAPLQRFRVSGSTLVNLGSRGLHLYR